MPQWIVRHRPREPRRPLGEGSPARGAPPAAPEGAGSGRTCPATDAGFWAVTRYGRRGHDLEGSGHVLLVPRHDAAQDMDREGSTLADHHAEHGSAAAQRGTGSSSARASRRAWARSSSRASQGDRRSSTDRRREARATSCARIAAELPLIVIAELVGIPIEDRNKGLRVVEPPDRLRRSSSQNTGPGQAAAMEMWLYAEPARGAAPARSGRTISSAC